MVKKLYNMILFYQDNYLYYKSKDNEDKLIACKCNENATGYCLSKQPFGTTINNNVKVRKNGLYLSSYQ